MIVVLIEHRVLDFQSMRQDRGTVKDRERVCLSVFVVAEHCFWMGPSYFICSQISLLCEVVLAGMGRNLLAVSHFSIHCACLDTPCLLGLLVFRVTCPP